MIVLTLINKYLYVFIKMIYYISDIKKINNPIDKLFAICDLGNNIL